MAALVFLSCLRDRASGAITPQLMYPGYVCPAKHPTALRAGHRGEHVTRNDVSWDVLPHVQNGAPSPRTRHDPPVVGPEVVFVPKVTHDAASICRNERRALRPMARPPTWMHGRARGTFLFTT